MFRGTLKYYLQSSHVWNTQGSPAYCVTRAEENQTTPTQAAEAALVATASQNPAGNRSRLQSLSTASRVHPPACLDPQPEEPNGAPYGLYGASIECFIK